MHVRCMVWATIGPITVAAFALQAHAQTLPFDKRQQRPDLIVQSVGFATNPVRDRYGRLIGTGALMGTCNKVRVTIRNSSSKRITKPFVVIVYLGKKRRRGYRYYTGLKHRKTIDGLGPQQSVQIEFTNFKITEILRNRKIHLVAKVDVTRQVREANEHNNQRGFSMRSDFLDWTRPCP